VSPEVFRRLKANNDKGYLREAAAAGGCIAVGACRNGFSCAVPARSDCRYLPAYSHRLLKQDLLPLRRDGRDMVIVSQHPRARRTVATDKMRKWRAIEAARQIAPVAYGASGVRASDTICGRGASRAVRWQRKGAQGVRACRHGAAEV